MVSVGKNFNNYDCDIPYIGERKTCRIGFS